jgi:hypothetical protein
MPVAAFTDLFNEALDDLSAFLATTTGLQVVNRPAQPSATLCDDWRTVVYSV